MYLGKTAPALPRKHDKLSCGATQENNNSFFPDELHIKLKYLPIFYRMFLTFFRVSLLAMNKYNLKNTALILQGNLDDDQIFIYLQ